MRQMSPAPARLPTSPTASPKWTTLEDQPSSGQFDHAHIGYPAVDILAKGHENKETADSTHPKKRPQDSPPLEGSFKKLRTDGLSLPSSSKKALHTGSTHPLLATGPRATVLQAGPSSTHRKSISSVQARNGSNGHQSGSTSAQSLRKHPRPPSPSSSDHGLDSRNGPAAPSSASPPTRARPTSESKILMDSLQKKAREIISHVEAKGCQGVALRLQILDMKTRVVELDKVQKSGSSLSNVYALENIVRRAAKAVVQCSRKDGCPDMDLRLMVLDLDTRLSEMDKASAH